MPRNSKPAPAPPEKRSIRDEAIRSLEAFKGPLVPESEACFPVEAGVKTGALRAELCAALDRIRSGAETDPFSNSIMLLALDISRRLANGKLSLSAIEALIQRLTVSAFGLRADRVKDYLGELDPEANAERIRKAVRALAAARSAKTGPAGKGKSGAKPLPFKKFKERVESELFGVVFTAHPTFGVSADLLHWLCQAASGCGEDGTPLTDAARKKLLQNIFTTVHRPDSELTLEKELALSLEAITNLEAAMRRVYDIVFSVAEELYPGRAAELTPRLLSVASWVGYDIDGRSDIKWSDTLHKRLTVQAVQLRHYRDVVRAIIKDYPAHKDNEPLWNTLDLLDSRLSLAINEIGEEMDVFEDFEAQEASGYERIRLIAVRMHEGLERRLVESTELIRLINNAIRFCPNGDAEAGAGKVRRLCILRAELANYGLGMARTHVRINASQIHNSIRKAIGMETSPDDPSNVKTYLHSLNDLLDRVKPTTINFGSILAERMSGKRLFMIVAQMLKYVDATTPVRFLIAECETSFTPLAALYFAKLFNVEDKIDISPLFETEKAISRGHRVIEELIGNPHYLAYVRKRGRLCIQTGFSDSGRYMGQPAAALAIENLKMNIGRILVRHKVKGVQLVIFDTHGESIGRGGHPTSLLDRLNYVSPPYCRRLFEENGLTTKEEISFQGGDGYLYFMNPSAAFAVISRILEFVLSPSEEGDNDPFYEEADYAAEIVNTIIRFNEDMMNDPDYAALLGAFGTNMLYPMGSRPETRQVEGGGVGAAAYTHPSEFRAIPQNAILQQLGMLANTLGGVGQVIRKDPVKFQALFEASPRFRRVMRMAEYAFAFSEIEVFKAYVDLFDPGRWLARAGRTSDQARSNDMKHLADILENIGIHAKLVKVFRSLQKEYMEIRAWLLGGDAAGRLAAGRGRVIGKEIRDDLLLLHGVRIALIQELFLLATRVPEFGLQTGVSHKNLVSELLNLDVPLSISQLERIFPSTVPLQIASDFGEIATYRSDDAQSYEQEHRHIFTPISRLYECIRRISTGIIHFIGAIG